ncbi:MAG: hypothetical protein M3Y30_12215, partial [Gemmatimonadota bacterium]|nr:hypothetical protein [Gemmatimonadota bacterium]
MMRVHVVDEDVEHPGGLLELLHAAQAVVSGSAATGCNQIVVGNPTEPPQLKHLQLELWLGKPPIDPDPALRGWQLLEIRQLGGDGGDEVSS